MKLTTFTTSEALEETLDRLEVRSGRSKTEIIQVGIVLFDLISQAEKDGKKIFIQDDQLINICKKPT